MKLGILYAMEKEAASLLAQVMAEPLPAAAGMPLFALPGGHILCLGGVGKVNAAMAAQLLLDRFQVEAILNPGCAGALTDLPVGTVVAAQRCVQHDVDTTLCGDPPGFVSTVARVDFPCHLPAVPGLIPGVVASGDWFGQDPDRAINPPIKPNSSVSAATGPPSATWNPAPSPRCAFETPCPSPL